MRRANRLPSHCFALMPSVLEMAVEYAFYLLVEGQKTQVRWYEGSPTHTFTLTLEEAGRPVQIRGFVRAAETPKQKLSAASLFLNTAPLAGADACYARNQ